MPLVTNAFGTNDAYHQIDLTAAVQFRDREFGMIRNSGIYNERGIRTRMFQIDSRNGVIQLTPFTEPGTAPTPSVAQRGAARSFSAPRIAKSRKLAAEDFQGVRAHGSADLESFVQLRTDAQDDLRRTIEQQLELIYLSGAQGAMVDGDGVVYHNAFDATTGFGGTRVSIDFDLGTAATEMKLKCMLVKQSHRLNLNGDVQVGLPKAYVDNTFFNAFVTHPTVSQFYLQWQAANTLQGVEDSFVFGGIQWINYDANWTGADGTPIVGIPAGEGFCIPSGTQSTFIARYAPADLLPFANTVGLPFYSLEYGSENGRPDGTTIEVQSNPIALMTRPLLSVRLFTT